MIPFKPCSNHLQCEGEGLDHSTFFFKQHIFCHPNANESQNTKFWDCIQARRPWQWATFIMHRLIGLRNDNYDKHSLEASP